jgi:hypothetical protein
LWKGRNPLPLPTGECSYRNPLAFAAKYFYFRTFREICEAHNVGRGNGICEVNRWETQGSGLSSQVSGFGVLPLQSIQANFFSVLTDGGHDIQCHGESAASVFERY